MKWVASGLLLFLLTGCYNPFKAPINPNQDIAHFIQMTKEQIQKEGWSEAKQTQTKLEASWSEIRTRVSLNASSSDLSDMDISLGQLATYIEQKEKTLALAEIEKVHEIWEGIARI